MNSRMKLVFHSAAFGVLFVLIFFTEGCKRSPDYEMVKKQTVELPDQFVVPYDSSRIVRNIYQRTLNKYHIKYFIVTSIDSQYRKVVTPRPVFNRIEVFTYDSTRHRFITMFVDVFENGQAAEFRDITHDGIEEIIVHRNSGGENSTVSIGLNVYGWTAGRTMETLFLSDDGNPIICDLDKDKIDEIIVTDRYLGVMPESDAITYTTAIYAFDSEYYSLNNSGFSSYFKAYIISAQKKYERMRRKIVRIDNDEGFPLYREFVEWMLWITASGKTKVVKTLWEKEKWFLQNYLPEEQYNDLDTFVSDLDLEEQLEQVKKINT